MTNDSYKSQFVPQIVTPSETAENMRHACIRFLDSLTPDLRRKAQFDFSDSERQRWHYVPREMFERSGVLLKDMKLPQRAAAFKLIASGLSPPGFEKATTIVKLEATLGEMERTMGTTGLVRDSDLYYLSVFGDPTNSHPWGWRAEGHHLSLNYTIVNRDWIAPNPFFFGANPAQVRPGPAKGLRILAREEELARNLLTSLNATQKGKVIISSTAPADIITRASPRVKLGAAEGIAAESMTPDQRKHLDKLIHTYIDRLPDDLARVEKTKIRNANLHAIHFAWAGAEEVDKPHYYRLHGPFFFVEYDNTQNNANHIHTVWRHLEGDFGLDILRLHYKEGHSME